MPIKIVYSWLIFFFRFRVLGARGLRVVDGSAMPTVPSGNIHIPVVMMAERAADFIKEEYLTKGY